MLFSIFARLTIFLMLPMITFVVGASLLGGTQPIHPALRGFNEGCVDVPQPCWYGIVPEQTPLNEALTQLTALGFETGQDETNVRNRYYFEADTCVIRLEAEFYESPIYAIRVDSCHDLYIGDLISELGIPLVLIRSGCDGTGPQYVTFPSIAVVNQPFDYNMVLSEQVPIDGFVITSSTINVGFRWQIKQPFRHSRTVPITAPQGCG